MFTKTANKQNFQRVVFKPEFRGNGLPKKYFYETEKYLKEQTGGPVNLMLTTMFIQQSCFKTLQKARLQSGGSFQRRYFLWLIQSFVLSDDKVSNRK